MKNGLFKMVSATTLAGLMFVGCGGGSSSGSSSSTPTVSTGTFIDAQVKGLHYKTATQEGDTNDAGEFKYLAGETIEFKLGNLSLGSVNADGLITPYTLAGDTNILNPSDKAVNIALLLQNFDADRTDTMLDVLKLKDMDLSTFSLSDTPATNEGKISTKFADNSFVTTSGVLTPTLIDAQTAKTNLINGVSLYSFVSGKTIVMNDPNPAGYMTLVFDANGNYEERGFEDEVNSSNQPVPYTCYGKWKDLGNNKIAGTCDEGETIERPEVTGDVMGDNGEIHLTFSDKTLSVGSSVTVNGKDDNGQAITDTITIKSVSNISTSSFILTNSMISGKEIHIEEYDGFLQFKADGTYYETSDDGSCTGTWVLNSNGTVTSNQVCIDSEGGSDIDVVIYTFLSEPKAGSKLSFNVDNGSDIGEVTITSISSIASK